MDIKALIHNSQSALFAAIEIHNKPIFPYRYEVCVILLINSWELLLKAFLIEHRPEIKILYEDGTTKSFEECVTNVQSTIGNDFSTTTENLQRLYDYRCNIIHFYQEDIGIILHSLISKSVVLYHRFLLKYFGIDVSERTNLILLPIGFRGPVSPIDFLSNESEISKANEHVQKFIKRVVESTHRLQDAGIEDSILISYKMEVINENRTKNADIIAAITKDPAKATIMVEKVMGKEFTITNDQAAQKIQIEEDNLFKKVYTMTYAEVKEYGHENFSDFKENKTFHGLMAEVKKNPNLHRTRYLDVGKNTGTKKDYYSKDVIKEMERHYKRIPK